MNNNIKVSVNDGVTWSTDSPFKAFAFLTAVEHYDFDSGLAQEIADLCYDLYIGSSHNVNAIDLIDFICEQYDDLPDDYKEIKNLLFSYLDNIDL
jgi:hypothetical protein